MAVRRTKILLDADVIIHFAKGDCLSLLPRILPEYEYVVLSFVYDELESLKHQLDNQIHIMKNITLIDFSKSSKEVVIEYAKLRHRFGKGESACMAYCRFNHDIVGSNNTKDVTEYCERNGITFLTTFDFLYLAFKKKLMSSDDCKKFITIVTSRGSNGIHMIDISKYKFNKEV